MKSAAFATLLLLGLVACDGSKVLGNECKTNDDCGTFAAHGTCMEPAFASRDKGYCTIRCQADDDCSAKPGFQCGSVEATSHGLFNSTKTEEARYCTRKN